jgi:DNA-binding MarR family transcriptional regulator
MIKDENFTTIQGWMRTKLKLKNNELLVYSIIYGMSQKDNQAFNAGLSYLCDWTGSSKQGILNNLKSLIDKGYIIKQEYIINNIKRYEYKAVDLNLLFNK